MTHFCSDRKRTSLDAIKVITNDRMIEMIPKSRVQSKRCFNTQMKGKTDNIVASGAHKGESSSAGRKPAALDYKMTSPTPTV